MSRKISARTRDDNISESMFIVYDYHTIELFCYTKNWEKTWVRSEG